MPIQVRVRDGVHILALHGEFTAGRHLARPLTLTGQQLDDLQTTLESLLDAGAKNILLDLASVTFMDSAGLGELVASKKRTTEHGGDVKILRPADRIRKLLEMVALDHVFEIHEDEQAAVASFS